MLRGSASATPLRVKRWTLDDLEAVMRQATAGTAGQRPRRRPRRRAPSSRRQGRATWKAIVTVVLLGVLAAAVTVVLLQSAGIISWGFLGPTA